MHIYIYIYICMLDTYIYLYIHIHRHIDSCRQIEKYIEMDTFYVVIEGYRSIGTCVVFVFAVHSVIISSRRALEDSLILSFRLWRIELEGHLILEP